MLAVNAFGSISTQSEEIMALRAKFRIVTINFFAIWNIWNMAFAIFEDMSFLASRASVRIFAD